MVHPSAAAIAGSLSERGQDAKDSHFLIADASRPRREASSVDEMPLLFLIFLICSKILSPPVNMVLLYVIIFHLSSSKLK